MIMEGKYRVDVANVSTSNLLSNKGILSLFENIACLHSDIAGYGMNQIEKTHLTWVLLHWKVHVIKRVPYGSTVTVKTWAGKANAFFTMRDFEMYDEKNNLICIASSKWTLINTENNSITRITDDVISCYEPEEKCVFKENDIAKLKKPEMIGQPSFVFTVLRKDIDVNQHMHNLYYLDYAYEALPEEVYKKPEANDFEIMYKSGAKLGNTVSCFYVPQENNEHFIVMQGPDEKQLHAIIKLKF